MLAASAVDAMPKVKGYKDGIAFTSGLKTPRLVTRITAKIWLLGRTK